MYNFSVKPFLAATLLLAGVQVGFAQDYLVNSLKNNQSANSAESFKFTDVINIENTPVKNPINEPVAAFKAICLSEGL